MENNQQEERNESIPGKSNEKDFTNGRPGQQLPAQNEILTGNQFAETTKPETHSESSRPQGENETLGTP